MLSLGEGGGIESRLGLMHYNKLLNHECADREGQFWPAAIASKQVS